MISLTILTCLAFLSTSLNTATVLIPSFLAVFITRHAISPRLATTSLSMDFPPFSRKQLRGNFFQCRVFAMQSVQNLKSFWPKPKN
jgi:hypothetical protein